MLYFYYYRYLSKCYIRVQKGERLPDLVQYLNVNLNTKSSLNESCSFDSLIAAYEHRAARYVCSVQIAASKHGVSRYMYLLYSETCPN